MELVTYQPSCQSFCTLEWPYQNLFIDQVTWQTCPILWSTSDSKVTRFGLIINIFVSRFEVHHACKYIYIYIYIYIYTSKIKDWKSLFKSFHTKISILSAVVTFESLQWCPDIETTRWLYVFITQSPSYLCETNVSLVKLQKKNCK